ncbi:MAG: translation initiation factor IF-2 [Candidatus Tectimicrobiota bacterium]
MAGVRVYELARDLGISSKDLMEELRGQGIEVKSHMSTMDEETAGLILDLYRHQETTVATLAPPAVESSEIPPQAQSQTMPSLSESESVSRQPELTSTVLSLPEALTVKDFAEALGLKTKDVLMQLMSLGTVASINTVIGLDLANTVAQKLGQNVLLVSEEESFERHEDKVDLEHHEPRAPVVTIMGHVDHGKTSLLDAIREANIQATEAGGITQHIGAYEVETPKGKLVFLDTPGHEAFTAMRARGAQITDIVVLVVAANDGVMPQTREAIAHAKAANVPIVVAINKIDLPDANPDRVKQQLSELELIPEEWGGNTIFVEVSARQKLGLDDLLELILLQAEILELQSDPYQMAKGTIVEAKLDKTRGPIATVLIQKGALQVGDAYVAGVQYGRVRAMFDDRGHRITMAGPSTPVEVLGFSDVPAAGDPFTVVEDERKARHISSIRQEKQRTKQLTQTSRVTLDDLYRRISAGEVKDLNLVIKGDVQGSVQALWDAIAKLESDKVRLRLIHGSTGAITESDIMLASASNAIVIGFNVRPIVKAAELAVQEHVDVRLYTVIYEAISDVEKAMVGLLKPTYTEKILGRAEVKVLFHISRVGAIAGCHVREGTIRRNTSARVLRDNVVIYEGRVVSLRRIKDDVDEVSAGFECGIGLGRYQDIKEGDVIESFMLEEVAPQL